MDKKENRLRRARRGRARISQQGVHRLTVHRTPQHTYAQVITAEDSKVVASVSTLQADIKKDVKHGGNIDAAKVIGKAIAEKAAAVGVKKVAFDRSGFKYHGRVKALADAAREAGLDF